MTGVTLASLLTSVGTVMTEYTVELGIAVALLVSAGFGTYVLKLIKKGRAK